MELWNTRNLKAPPTFTYQAEVDEVDINHLANILQDGIKFYKEQYLLNLETSLLARIVYRMKRKFRNSKDFHTLEKVKKDLMIFLQIDMYKRLELLLSILPTNVSQRKIFLPTRNMMDFILVRLQGVGKILCRIIDMCELTMGYYECRLHLGHFWRIAIVAIGLVSRIYILSLNIIKFTCLLYLRLLPFSHKLKNSGVEWLPADYVFPKDLKEWLNIEWSTLEEVIEIPDKEFEYSLIDLVEDSDDDVEFCSEYIELDEDEDVEIIEQFKRLNKKIKPIEYENSVTILRGFLSDNIDTGEVVSSADENDKEEVIQLNSNYEQPSPVPASTTVLEKQEEMQNISVEEIDVGRVITLPEDERNNSNSSDDDSEKSSKADSDDCNEKVRDEVSEGNCLKSNQQQMEDEMEADVLISLSDEEVEVSSNDSIEFVEEIVAPSKRPSMVTSDYISLNTVNNRFLIQDNEKCSKGISSKLLKKRKKHRINKNITNRQYSPVKKERVKPPHIGVKKESSKLNPTQIGVTAIKEEKVKAKNKHSNVIKVFETPEKKIDFNRNCSEKNINEIIAISGSTLKDYVQDTPVSAKRKRKWRNGNESNKKSRWSKDSTIEIINTSTDSTNNNKFSENTLEYSSLEVPETSKTKINGKENQQNNHSWNESLEIGEHSFCKTIMNTSTPAKRRRERRKKTKNRIKRLNKQRRKEIEEINNSSLLETIQSNKTVIKKNIRKNHSVIVSSQGNNNKTISSVSIASCQNTSGNLIKKKTRNKLEAKKLNKSKTLKRKRSFRFKSSIAIQSK